jgi:hypothetical protein
MAILDVLSKPFEPSEDIDESNFSDWYSDISERADISSDPDDPRNYYDYRAAYEAGATLGRDKHLPSQFKHDLHPNRYIIDKELGVYDTKYEKPAKFEDMIVQSFRRKEYEEDIFDKR